MSAPRTIEDGVLERVARVAAALSDCDPQTASLVLQAAANVHAASWNERQRARQAAQGEQEAQVQ